MKRQWTNEELIADFTISTKELDLIGDGKTEQISRLNYELCVLHYLAVRTHQSRIATQVSASRLFQ